MVVVRIATLSGPDHIMVTKFYALIIISNNLTEKLLF